MNPFVAQPQVNQLHRVETALTRVVTVEVLQNLQERFAALGRMTVCLCTVEGEFMTLPTWGSRFSEMIGTSNVGRAVFLDAIRDSLSSVGAVQQRSCLEGMQTYVAPIMHDGVRLALIVVGTRTHTPPDRRMASEMAARYELDPDELLRQGALIDPFRGGAPEAIHRFADVLAHMIAALYAQALCIERQLGDLRVIHRLSDLLTGTLDLQEILDLTVRRVVDAMPVKACAIRLLNEATGELVIQAVFNLSEEYLRKGPVFLRDNAVDATAFAGETVYIEDASNDPRNRYSENARREGIVSGLSVPMTYRGETVGVIRVYTSKPHVFSSSEEALLRSIGSQAAAAIIHSRLYAEQTEAEKVRRQVETAGHIQRRMLPGRVPRHHALEFGCVYEPTLDLGGDLYDFLELPEGRLGVCIADVVGKGLPAALMMASLRSALRAYAHGNPDLAATVAAVNRHMHRETAVTEFATMVYGVFTPEGRTFSYCNAGHPPPLLLRGDYFNDLAAGGMVLGVEADAVYDCEVVSVHPGDVVVMITDGVTEAMNFQGEPFGRHRLLASIWNHRSLDAKQLAKQILWDVRRFVGLADQSDDITIVVARAM